VLGAVKAEPCGWPPMRPALTAPARGCLSLSRVGTEKRASGRTEKLGQVKGDEASRQLLGSIAGLFSSFSTAPRQDRRGVVVKCLEIVFGLIPTFSVNDAFTILQKERTMNHNWLVGSVEGLVMACPKRLSSRPLRDRPFRKVRSFRPSPILCWRSTSRQARHRERLTLAASAQDLRHPRLWWGV
jgi:hypothetical protein